MTFWPRGCGSVGRAVASDSRGTQFESSYIECLLSTLLKDENKENDILADNLILAKRPRSDQNMLAPDCCPDFLDKVSLNFSLGLVTSCCSCETACWRPACRWLG